ncbi:MAG: hypothetical protein IM674_04285 [Brevundimonas sp.]|nr:hypothetical protein [Brevundimonas sp.]
MADDITLPGAGEPVKTFEDAGGKHYQGMVVGYRDAGTPVPLNEKPATEAGQTEGNNRLAAIEALLDGTLDVNVLAPGLPTGAATEATLASALATLVALASGNDDVAALLRQLVLAATSPAGFDRSLGRGRVTALVESGTVTTVSTVTTVTTVSGLTNIDGRPGAMLINQSNLSAWADCVRRSIT